MRMHFLPCLFTVLVSASSLPVSAADSPPVDLTGVWMPTSIGPDGARVETYPGGIPYTPEARAELDAYEANYSPEVDDASRSCLPYGMPRQMLVRAQYPTEIIQTDDRITMIVELHNDVRRIWMDGRKRPSGLLPSWMGFSTGEWQGDELVITTTHLRPGGFPDPKSTQLTVTERIRLVDGGEIGPMLALEMTIDDPVYYTRPFTARTYFRQYPGLEMGEYFCSEDLWRQNLDGRTGDYIPWR